MTTVVKIRATAITTAMISSNPTSSSQPPQPIDLSLKWTSKPT